MYGAGLLEALRHLISTDNKFSSVECFGVGGELMRSAGCDTVVDAAKVAVVGLVEVVKHLPGIYREFHRLLAEVDRRKPDVAVLIDFSDFNFRLARELHARRIPVVYYISPQLWAWRQGRIKLVKRYVRKMLVIFPFEREFYSGHQVDAEFVGHPLAELLMPAVTRDEFAQRYQLDPAKNWIALLPGSRRGEIQRHATTMAQAAVQLGDANEYLVPVASTLDTRFVQQAFPPNATKARFTFVDDARVALMHSRAAVVASGTATVEAALIGTPFVMVYRLSSLTYFFGKRMVKVPFYAMPNLIAGREVVPELVQDGFTAQNVARQLAVLLQDGMERSTMLSGLAEIREKLRAAGVPAAERAARAVLEVVST